MTRIKKLKELISRNPDDVFTLFALAKEYENCSKEDISISYYNRLLTLTPKDISIYYNKGLLLLKMNQKDEAKKTFFHGLTLAKKNMNFEYIKLFKQFI